MLYFNDGLAAGRASARVATAGTRTAREHPNPTVTLMSEYANQHDGSPLWLWAVVTDWLLDAGARRGARIALADLAAQRAGYDLAELTWKQRSALRRSEEHTSELQSPCNLVCRLLLEKKKKATATMLPCYAQHAQPILF